MNPIRTGVYSAQELIRRLGRAGFAECIKNGIARKIRHGWYAIGDPPQDLVIAAHRGGVLSCVSALDKHGVWVPEQPDVHVRTSGRAARVPDSRFCHRFGRDDPACTAIDDVSTALQYAARCLDRGEYVAVCDSVMNLGFMTGEQIDYQFRNAPKRILALLDRCDGRAMSGPESMIRFFLEGKHVKVRIQVQIDTVGQVDLLVGKHLIIETDGREFHLERFDEDRARDVAASALGYTTLRFSRDQVLYDWEYVTTSIMEAIAAGVHQRPSRRVKCARERFHTEL
ncbi:MULTISPECIES: DUF559 domain-containing protein [unclassified Gordonia (in: high G+C Gram-positive bacteria)]|uniref:DUF559 domain-containing protein n=1 Tax=unclassified Gordonia (in: high G+C Gram-positive bacteria) TaxID=2657482 RepID=UPI001F05152C|nr:DUF559 domain-containing protein [Gordonia sp. PDNC005]